MSNSESPQARDPRHGPGPVLETGRFDQWVLRSPGQYSQMYSCVVYLLWVLDPRENPLALFLPWPILPLPECIPYACSWGTL